MRASTASSGAARRIRRARFTARASATISRIAAPPVSTSNSATGARFDTGVTARWMLG
jgi:hypothetical protein